jgi:hypothetical protein
MKRFVVTPAMAFCFFALLTSQDVLASELKQHLMTAIDATTGRSEGELSGSMADFFKAQTRSSLPVRVQVKTIKRFATVGCSRLEATLVQDGVPTTNGQTVPIAIRYELNLCRNGQPPTEGIDLGSASRALSRDAAGQ